MLCDRMDIDVWEVVDAAATKPYGFMPFKPGPGLGGHCLPVDPFYLAWKAREFDTPTEFIELAGEVNQKMPYFCVERIARALNDESKPLRGSKIAILGVAYKAGVGDVRESPALKIIGLLRERGAVIAYHDAHVPELTALDLVSQPLEDALAEQRLRGRPDPPPGGRSRAGRPLDAARRRLPRRDARHRGRQARTALRWSGAGRRRA